MSRRGFFAATLALIAFGSAFAEEIEAIITKYDKAERMVTIQVDGKEKSYKLYKQAKFKMGKKLETDAEEFLTTKIGKKGSPKVKLSIDSDQITEISIEKKK
jgi:uncharacterized Zn finger protein